MGKLKEQLMAYSYAEQQQLMQEQFHGWPPMESPFTNAYTTASDGMSNGNNSSSPCTEKTEVCAVSKPKTLIFNERAKRNITTQEIKPSTAAYTITPTQMENMKEKYPLLYQRAVVLGYGPAV